MHGEGFNLLSGLSHAFHLPISVVGAIIVMILILLAGIIARYSISKRKKTMSDKWFYPDGKLSLFTLFDLAVNFIGDLANDIIGEKDAYKFVPLFVSFFIFILISNLMGLIPGMTPPTDDLNVTLALGIFSFIYYNAVGIKEHGWKYIKQFLGPVWYLAWFILPLEIISNLFRPMTLGLRLWGNMTGDHAMISLFTDLTNPIPVPVIFLFVGLFVSFLQAYVFTLLSMVYISLAKSHDH